MLEVRVIKETDFFLGFGNLARLPGIPVSRKGDMAKACG